MAPGARAAPWSYDQSYDLRSDPHHGGDPIARLDRKLEEL